MRDPHVVALHYRLEAGPQLAFNDPPPLERDTARFSLRLDQGELRVLMKEHFAAETAARQVVDGYLAGWELSTGLEYGPRAIRFTFEHSEIVDRDPQTPDGIHGALNVHAGEALLVGNGVVLKLGLGQYPAPPERFEMSLNVETMWLRYSGYLADREPLLSMAYMCLSVIEASVGRTKRKRPRAASRYRVEEEVLDALGRLATEKGDAATARKVQAGRPFQRLSDAEIAWTEAVIKTLIRRVGKWAADHDAKWPQITMKDFPKL